MENPNCHAFRDGFKLKTDRCTFIWSSSSGQNIQLSTHNRNWLRQEKQSLPFMVWRNTVKRLNKGRRIRLLKLTTVAKEGKDTGTSTLIKWGGSAGRDDAQFERKTGRKETILLTTWMDGVLSCLSCFSSYLLFFSLASVTRQRALIKLYLP